MLSDISVKDRAQWLVSCTLVNVFPAVEIEIW